MTAPTPNAELALGLLSSIAYFTEHEQLLQEVLDDVVKAARSEPGDTPALTFSSIAAAMAADLDRAVTISALAVMRLAAIEYPGGAA